MNAPLPAISDLPPSDDAIVIDVTLTSDDLITFNVEGVGIHPGAYESARSLNSMKGFTIKFMLVMVATGALWLWAGGPSPGFFSWTFAGLFFGIAISCLLTLKVITNATTPKGMRSAAQRAMQTGRFGGHLGSHRCIVDRRGVEIISTYSRSIHGWERVLGVSSMPSGITIDLDSLNGFVIPRRATDPATLDRLTQFVERMIATTPNSERERTLEALRASDQTCPKCKYPLKNLRDARCPECGLSLNRATLSLPIRGAGEPRASAPPTSPPTEAPTSPGAR